MSISGILCEKRCRLRCFVVAVWQEVAHMDTGAAEKGRKKGRKRDHSGMVSDQAGKEVASGGAPTKENVETERLSAQASDASLPWQRCISGLPGNG